MQPNPSPTPAGFAPGAVVAGRYRLDALLGEGGMATVWRSLDLAAGKPVALKILRADLSQLPEAQERFRREGDLLMKLHHPAIVELDTYGSLPDGTLFLAMELLEGETLGARMKREGPLALRALAPIVGGACAALAFAHQRGVVHRDLKPENVFLLAHPGGPAVKLLDFGISKVFGGERITQTGEILGTPRYMAPEQLAAEHDLDARVDVYALGIILYEALAGVSPFQASSVSDLLVAVLNGKPAPLKSVKPTVPPAVESVVMRAISRAREARYATVAELAQAFLSAVGAVAVAPVQKGAATAPLGSVSEEEVKRAVAAASKPPSTVVGHGPFRPVAHGEPASDAVRPGTFSAFAAPAPSVAASVPVPVPQPVRAAPVAAVLPPSASTSAMTATPGVAFAQTTPAVMAAPLAAPPSPVAPHYTPYAPEQSLAGVDAAHIPGDKGGRLGVVVIAVLAGAISMAAVLIGLSMMNHRAGAHETPTAVGVVDAGAAATPEVPVVVALDAGAQAEVLPTGVVLPPPEPGGGGEVAPPATGGGAANEGAHHDHHGHEHEHAAGGGGATGGGGGATGGGGGEGGGGAGTGGGGGAGTGGGGGAGTGGGGGAGTGGGGGATATPAGGAELYAAARDAYRGGDMATCIALSQQAMQAGGAPIATVRLQADCYRAIGDNAHALADYQRFCRISPDSPSIAELQDIASSLGGTCP